MYDYRQRRQQHPQQQSLHAEEVLFHEVSLSTTVTATAPPSGGVPGLPSLTLVQATLPRGTWGDGTLYLFFDLTLVVSSIDKYCICCSSMIRVASNIGLFFDLDTCCVKVVSVLRI